MNESHENRENSDFSVTLFNPAETAWAEVEGDIMELEQLCFGDDMSSDEWKVVFDDPNSVIVFLQKGKRIIGFTCGLPSKKEALSLNIDTTDIHPDYQGQGHVVPLISMLEAEARKRGYQYLTRDAMIGNGYADKIERNYQGRIVDQHDHDSDYGPQRYFKISLAAE